MHNSCCALSIRKRAGATDRADGTALSRWTGSSSIFCKPFRESSAFQRREAAKGRLEAGLSDFLPSHESCRDRSNLLLQPHLQPQPSLRHSVTPSLARSLSNTLRSCPPSRQQGRPIPPSSDRYPPASGEAPRPRRRPQPKGDDASFLRLAAAAASLSIRADPRKARALPSRTGRSLTRACSSLNSRSSSISRLAL